VYGAPVVQQGLALVLPIVAPDSGAIAPGGPSDAPLDLAATRSLIEERWSFGELLARDLGELEPNVAAMARTLALPHARVGLALLERQDTTAAIAMLERAAHLAPGQDALVAFVRELRQGTTRP
jgi:hypothetical protein